MYVHRWEGRGRRRESSAGPTLGVDSAEAWVSEAEMTTQAGTRSWQLMGCAHRCLPPLYLSKDWFICREWAPCRCTDWLPPSLRAVFRCGSRAEFLDSSGVFGLNSLFWELHCALQGTYPPDAESMLCSAAQKHWWTPRGLAWGAGWALAENCHGDHTRATHFLLRVCSVSVTAVCLYSAAVLVRPVPASMTAL